MLGGVEESRALCEECLSFSERNEVDGGSKRSDQTVFVLAASSGEDEGGSTGSDDTNTTPGVMPGGLPAHSTTD